MSDYPPPPPSEPTDPGYGAAPPPYQPPAAPPPGGAYALWPKRALGYLIDVAIIIPFYVVALIFFAFDNGFFNLLGFLLYLAAIGVAIWNQVFKQGQTGQSIGKGVVGIKLISEETGQPLGPLMTFVRGIVHIVDALPCYVGFLWPLWDEKRQTVADKILNTIVVDV